MRRTVWFQVCTLLVLVWGSSALAPARAQDAPAATRTAELDSLIERARKLEDQRRWGEALTLYEDALREHFEDPKVASQLGERLDTARIHYDLGRRYSDSSFVRSLTSLKESDAYAMYSEVLLKVQSHYVGEPNWGKLVRRGTASLLVALNDGAFARRHLRYAKPEQIAALAEQLDRMPSQRAIGSRQQAVDAVAQAVSLGRQHASLPPAVTVMEYVAGASGALDEYSAFLTPDQLSEVYSQIEGNFVGLGVELKAADGALLIVKTIPGSPAERGGIRAGDRIVAVDGRSTADLSTDAAADLLQGQEGSMVEVTLVRGQQAPRRLTLRRQHVDVPSVDDVKIVDREQHIGYLKLTCFQKTSTRDLDNALWSLHRQGMRTLVIDLRGNPGGLLSAAVEAADRFLETGVIVSTRGRSAAEDYNYTAQRAGTWRVPLVVLIDGESASASEIFAGAIRDHHRGTVIGARSYGKGSVQGIFPLSVAGAGIRLTTAKFYAPSGRPISHVGVQPDIVVERTARPIDGNVQPVAGEPADRALDEAINAARRQLARR
jgi:carboxyl-terminal processing protease